MKVLAILAKRLGGLGALSWFKSWSAITLVVLIGLVGLQSHWLDKKSQTIRSLEEANAALNVAVQQHQQVALRLQQKRLLLSNEISVLKGTLRAQRQQQQYSVQQTLRKSVPETPEGSLNWLNESIDSLDFDVLFSEPSK